MKIGGFQPITLSDYAGKVAAIVFCQGCNFCCPWCHNQPLLPTTPADGRLISAETVLSHLRCRRHQLDGVVISGGEPTIQDELPEFLSLVKAQGYAVKLDTNGSRPCVLDTLIARRLVDFIAMDVKAPWAMYTHLAGTAISIALLQKSIQIISASGIAHEFRTTATPALSARHLGTIATALPRQSPYRIQPYRTPIES